MTEEGVYNSDNSISDLSSFLKDYDVDRLVFEGSISKGHFKVVEEGQSFASGGSEN